MKKYFTKIAFPFGVADEGANANLDALNENADKDAAKGFEPSDTDSAEVKALKEQNKRLFERTKKAEGFEKQADGSWSKKPKPAEQPLPTPPKPKDEDVTERLGRLEQTEKKRQFGHKHQLSPEETDNLFRFAGSSDPEEALKSPFFQAGLKESRRASRVAEATPSSTNRSAKVDGKTFAEMTPEERSKNWSKITGVKK